MLHGFAHLLRYVSLHPHGQFPKIVKRGMEVSWFPILLTECTKRFQFLLVLFAIRFRSQRRGDVEFNDFTQVNKSLIIKNIALQRVEFGSVSIIDRPYLRIVVWTARNASLRWPERWIKQTRLRAVPTGPAFLRFRKFCLFHLCIEIIQILKFKCIANNKSFAARLRICPKHRNRFSLGEMSTVSSPYLLTNKEYNSSTAVSLLLALSNI